MSEGCWELNKPLELSEIAKNSFSVISVSFDSLVPTRLTLRADLRLLYLKGPAFSIVVNSLGVVSESDSAPPVVQKWVRRGR